VVGESKWRAAVDALKRRDTTVRSTERIEFLLDKRKQVFPLILRTLLFHQNSANTRPKLGIHALSGRVRLRMSHGGLLKANAITRLKNRPKHAPKLLTEVTMNLIAGDATPLDFIADEDAQRLSCRHIGQNRDTNSVGCMIDTHLHVRTTREARRHRESRGINPDFLASSTDRNVRAGVEGGRRPLDPRTETAVTRADKIAQFPETAKPKLALEGLTENLTARVA
jgi:hypothetical protein